MLHLLEGDVSRYYTINGKFTTFLQSWLINASMIENYVMWFSCTNGFSVNPYLYQLFNEKKFDTFIFYEKDFTPIYGDGYSIH